MVQSLVPPFVKNEIVMCWLVLIAPLPQALGVSAVERVEVEHNTARMPRVLEMATVLLLRNRRATFTTVRLTAQ
jgi:hypothetical protein